MRWARVVTLILATAAVARADDGAPPQPPAVPAAPPARPAAAKAVAKKPAWVKVWSGQETYAKSVGLPVWHETDLGEGRTLRFVLIPPTSVLPNGVFKMGTPPKHRTAVYTRSQWDVELTKPYYLSITEVSNAEFRRWRPDHSSEHAADPLDDRRSPPLDADAQPVTRVSWGTAVEFAAWLTSRETGRTYRLPTEAEWEHACRAGTSTLRWWNELATGAKGRENVLDASYRRADPDVQEHEAFAFDDGFAHSAPVGSFAPNPWGLHDMLGNVLEWCGDLYSIDQLPTYPDRVSDPQGPSPEDAAQGAGGIEHVARGGAWWHGPEDVRYDYRRGRSERARSNVGFGIRLVMVATPK